MSNAATYSAKIGEPGPVSAIIPVWREAASLLATIREISAWPEVREVIVVVADATPEWMTRIERAGARGLTLERPSRGGQMNRGAAVATGEWLLFHHADTMLTPAHVRSLVALTARTEVVGGAYYRKFDERHPWLRWAEPVERWRNRSFGALYGDQSIFARRTHFQKLGGFADIPLMEDVQFSTRLRRSGKIVLLDPPIASSPRKHLQHGPWRTTLKNASLLLLYKLGVPPTRLHAWYYGNKVPVSHSQTDSQKTYTESHENDTHPVA